MEEKPIYLDLDKIRDYSFLKGKTISLGIAFEPCIHPEINKLIDILNKQDCKIIMTTNGHNLNKKEIPAIFDSNLEMITFSFDGISANTYNHIRRGGNFHKTVENISTFREKFSKHDTIFAITNTIMQYNLHEVVDSAKFWNDHNFDLIRLNTMVVREKDEFLLNNELWSVRDQLFEQLEEAAEWVVRESPKISVASPYYSTKNPRLKWADHYVDGAIKSKHKEARIPKIYPRSFQYGADFGMTFPCKSPFTGVRIHWDGTILLCCTHVVGNLYNNSFEEIWNGKQAESLRNKVLNSDELCTKCNYFRLCLNSHFVDVEDKASYFEHSVLANKDVIARIG